MEKERWKRSGGREKWDGHPCTYVPTHPHQITARPPLNKMAEQAVEELPEQDGRTGCRGTSGLAKRVLPRILAAFQLCCMVPCVSTPVG